MEIIAVGVLLFLIWISVLIYHLRRQDCSDMDRLLWVIVLCTLNILGVILYFFLGPKSENDRVLTEQELKDKFNKGV